MHRTSLKNIQILGKMKNFSDLVYNLIMEIFTIALLMYVLGVTLYGIDLIYQREELLEMLEGYNPNARDGDGDGIIQEGTKWERRK